MVDRRRVKRDEGGGVGRTEKLGDVSYLWGMCGKGVRMVSLGCGRYFIPNSKDQLRQRFCLSWKNWDLIVISILECGLWVVISENKDVLFVEEEVVVIVQSYIHDRQTAERNTLSTPATNNSHNISARFNRKDSFP